MFLSRPITLTLSTYPLLFASTDVFPCPVAPYRLYTLPRLLPDLKLDEETHIY